jgi:isocitrate dehydrogenase
MTKKVAVIRGDGVGPELLDALISVLNAVGTDVELIISDAGVSWWKKHGESSLISNDTWEVLNEVDACFKGPTTTPDGVNSPKSVAVSIRQEFGLYTNVRPIKTLSSSKKPLGDVNFVCVREATEGLYFGSEVKLNDDVYIAIRRITREACRKVARYAFEEAKRRGWNTIVAIHKSNILKQTCGVFLEEVERTGRDYSGIGVWKYHIDDMAQQIIKNPQIFNEKILLSTNLFMDIISEECSALVGSIGLIPSANIGDEFAMFEPAHGSAPKYAGMDRVNPTATILAGAWMLEYLGQKDKANVIRKATEDVISDGIVTYDLGGKAKLSEMSRAIVEKISDE